MIGAIEFLKALRTVCQEQKDHCNSCPANPECAGVLIRPDEATDEEILGLINKVWRQRDEKR